MVWKRHVRGQGLQEKGPVFTIHSLIRPGLKQVKKKVEKVKKKKNLNL